MLGLTEMRGQNMFYASDRTAASVYVIFRGWEIVVDGQSMTWQKNVWKLQPVNWLVQLGYVMGVYETLPPKAMVGGSEWHGQCRIFPLQVNCSADYFTVDLWLILVLFFLWIVGVVWLQPQPEHGWYKLNGCTKWTELSESEAKNVLPFNKQWLIELISPIDSLSLIDSFCFSPLGYGRIYASGLGNCRSGRWSWW